MEQGYRDKLIDERFARDKERIINHETHMKEQDTQINDLQRLTIEMGEMIKRHDERLDKHDDRLHTIEEKPAKTWNAASSAAISALVSGIVAALMALVFK